jgi:hypothetical protein
MFIEAKAWSTDTIVDVIKDGIALAKKNECWVKVQWQDKLIWIAQDDDLLFLLREVCILDPNVTKLANGREIITIVSEPKFPVL